MMTRAGSMTAPDAGDALAPDMTQPDQAISIATSGETVAHRSQ